MKFYAHTTLVVLFFLLISNTVGAKTRNLIIEETPDHQFGTANPVLLGDFIIYQTRADDVSYLWSYNTMSNAKIKIFTGALSQFRVYQDYIYVIDDLAYFVSGEDNNSLFWKTDGSLAGTTALNSPTFFPHHSKIGDFLFTWSSQATLLSTDGNEVIEHMISYPAINTLCPFSNNDVIAVINQNNSEDTTIVRSNEGVISNLSSDFSIQFEVREGNSFNLGGNCHILANDRNGALKEWFVVPEEGDITLMSNQLDVADVYSLFPYKDRVYVKAKSSTGNGESIFRLKTDLSGYDAEFSFSESLSLTTNMSLTSEYIIVETSIPNVSPTVRTAFYLDENLQQNEALGGNHQPIPTAYPTADGELFSFGYLSTYSETIDREDSNPLVIKDSYVSEVMTDQDSTDVYLKITDRGSQVESIVKIADTPAINHSTAGIWHDPLIQNQGLVINRGQRANGSNYLFVSVYTQDQGQPLWLAGNADIFFPQTTIDIELSFYEDTNFFEPDADTIKTSWGRVKLEMTSCDGLHATFTQANEQTRSLDLVRIDNTQFNYLCSD